MNAYLAILNFAGRHQSISFQELYKYLSDQEITFDDGLKISERNYMLLNIFRTCFENEEGRKPTDQVYTGRFFLNQESMAYLLSYQAWELAKADSSAARTEALKASRQATIAIYIAVFSCLVSLVAGLVPFFIGE